MQINNENDLLDFLATDYWRLMPDLMANRLTRGRFRVYSYIEAISKEITNAIIQGNGRIILSVPPRHGKSLLSSIWTPVWFLSLFPDRNVILSSYESDLAASWGRQVRNLITEHEQTIGTSLSEDSQAANRWNTKQGGGMVTAGIGGPITGRGAHLAIIDDPIKNWEEAMSPLKRQKAVDWFNSTLYTRLEPSATIIVIMTRWHEDDLAGWLLKEHEDDWLEIKLPAIAEENDPMGRAVGNALNPERYDEQALDRIKKAVGSRVWNALYQQRPSSEEGNILKRHWFKFYERCPAIHSFNEIIQSWDMSFTGKATSDFVVGQVWGRIGADKYLIDETRGRLGMDDTLKAFTNLSLKWPAAQLKLIENKANGPAVEDMLRKKIPGIVLWDPKGDKVSRANAISPQYESGNVYFPHPQICSWSNDLVEEFVAFPNAANDDRVDAMTMALLRLDEHGGVGGLRIITR